MHAADPQDDQTELTQAEALDEVFRQERSTRLRAVLDQRQAALEQQHDEELQRAVAEGET